MLRSLLDAPRQLARPARDETPKPQIVKAHKRRLAAAGDLVPVEAIDRSGLVITSEGQFVRVLEVQPPNTSVLPETDVDILLEGLRNMIGRLSAGQTVQIYTESRPVALDRVTDPLTQEIARMHGEPREAVERDDRLGVARWQLYSAMHEGLDRWSLSVAAVRFRTYVVCPFTPSDGRVTNGMRYMLTGRLGTDRAPLNRRIDTHRRAVQESLAHTNGLRAELEGLGLPVRQLAGEEVAALLWARFNPSMADKGHDAGSLSAEILTDFDGPISADAAKESAERLKSLIAGSAVDFKRSVKLAYVDDDLEQTIYTRTTASQTMQQWLTAAMSSPQPFISSLFVHALDRTREQRRANRSYKVLWGANRTRVGAPDVDRILEEQEKAEQVATMSSSPHETNFEISYYHTVRQPGPRPNAQQLAATVAEVAETIKKHTNIAIGKGEFEQFDLWTANLPLGRDMPRKTRKYGSTSAASMIPMSASTFGSPGGFPLGYSEPMRTMENLDPFDRAHPNHVMLVNGQSGTGKTATVNLILQRCLALGARGAIIDRSEGHFKLLTQLVPGARHITLGAPDETGRMPALNPWDVADPASVTAEKIAFLVQLHSLLISDRCSGIITASDRSHLDQAIRNVYAISARAQERIRRLRQEYGPSQDSEDLRRLTALAQPRERMLRDELMRMAREAAEDPTGGQAARELRAIAQRLEIYCDGKSYSWLVDETSSIDTQNPPLVVFDTAKIPGEVLTPAMFILVEYVQELVARNHAMSRQATVAGQSGAFAGKFFLVIDEAWHLAANPATGEYLNWLARRSRHTQMLLVVITQQLTDLTRTPEAIGLVRNSSIQLFLHQTADELEKVREVLSLTDAEIARIHRLKTLRGHHARAYMISARGRGELLLLQGERELWMTTSEVPEMALRDEMIRRCNGDPWRAIHALAKSHPLSAAGR